MAGAGISTNAGVPDFRSETGIYSRQDASSTMFDLDTFQHNPQVLYHGCRDVFLRLYEKGPVDLTAAHRFFRLLHNKGLLLRVYDQNVDCLTVAAIGDESCVRECHGTLRTARCSRCSKPSDRYRFQ
jgi:NAD-dependent histone deacetylase SIR2